MIRGDQGHRDARQSGQRQGRVPHIARRPHGTQVDGRDAIRGDLSTAQRGVRRLGPSLGGRRRGTLPGAWARRCGRLGPGPRHPAVVPGGPERPDQLAHERRREHDGDCATHKLTRRGAGCASSRGGTHRRGAHAPRRRTRRRLVCCRARCRRTRGRAGRRRTRGRAGRRGTRRGSTRARARTRRRARRTRRTRGRAHARARSSRRTRRRGIPRGPTRRTRTARACRGSRGSLARRGTGGDQAHRGAGRHSRQPQHRGRVVAVRTSHPGHLGGGGAAGPILDQAIPDDRAKARIVQDAQVRVATPDPGGDLRRGPGTEGRLPGGGEVRHCAKRENVRGRAHPIAGELLGGQVRHGRAIGRLRRRRIRDEPGVEGRTRPESHDPGSVAGQHDRRRVEFAVHDPGPVQRVQDRGQAGGDRENLGLRHRALLGHPFGQGGSGHVLRRNPGALGRDVIGHHRRQATGGATCVGDHPAEPPARDRVGRHRVIQHPDGHSTRRPLAQVDVAVTPPGKPPGHRELPHAVWDLA